MHVWIVQIGEAIAGLDQGARSGRCSMLCEALALRGHTVTWWSSTFHHFSKSYRFHRDTTVQLSPAVTVRLLHGEPPYSSNVSIARWRNQRAVAAAFGYELSTQPRPDAIVASIPTLEMSELAVTYAAERAVPVVVDIRDRWPDVYLRALPSLMRPIGRITLTPEYSRLRRVLDGASAVTAVAESDLGWVREHSSIAIPAKSFAIGYRTVRREHRHAPEAIRERFGIPLASKVAVFSGIFGLSYDLTTVLECAELLEGRGRTDIQIVLAGDGDQMPAIRARAAHRKNVTLTGWLDEASLALLLSIASAGICAYGADATQTLPNKPFEYMAAGLPQVSSLSGELAELLERLQVGLSYEAGDAEALANALEELLDQPPDVADRYRARVRETFASQFDSAKIYPAMASFIEAVAGGRVS